MNLSFTTRGWLGYGWDGFCRVASDYGFKGIEPSGVRDAGADGPLYPENAQTTQRQLRELGLSIPCTDISVNIADPAALEENCGAVAAGIESCAAVHIPYLRLIAEAVEGLSPEEEDEAVRCCLVRLLPLAEKEGVTLLLETFGLYADTFRLREMLESFAEDHLAALWDMQHPYRLFDESPETTIRNLGAYVKHVHLKDSLVEDGRTRNAIIGEGSLPVAAMLDALRSVNYAGFISLEWDPLWDEELGDPDVIFPHFVGYMSRFEPLSRAQSSLYRSRRGDGLYVWKKDTLIDLTFPAGAGPHGGGIPGPVLPQVHDAGLYPHLRAVSRRRGPLRPRPHRHGGEARRQGLHLGHECAPVVHHLLGGDKNRSHTGHREHGL
jgi:fatty-acyl-CoA synthase